MTGSKFHARLSYNPTCGNQPPSQPNLLFSDTCFQLINEAQGSLFSLDIFLSHGWLAPITPQTTTSPSTANMNTPSSSTALQDLPTTIKPAALLPLREAGAGDSYHVYLGQAYGRAHIPSIGFPTRRLRKVILRDICGCNFYLAAAALIIGIVTFVAGLFSIQLQQWTSLKDYLEYCQAEVVSLCLQELILSTKSTGKSVR